MGEDNITATMDRMLRTIIDAPKGLDAHILAEWYDIVINEAKSRCPSELRASISVHQDDVLPMKFQVNMSRRAAKYVIEAVENNLEKMPFATRLYFEKFEEMAWEEFVRQRHAAPQP